VKSRTLLLAAAAALLLAAAPRHAAAEAEPMRGIYIPAQECTDPMLSLLRSIGLNTIFCTYNGYDMEIVTPAIAAAKRHNLRVIWTMWFHGGVEITRGFEDNPRRLVREDGTVSTRTTCPLDTIYWERAVAERALTLARLAKDAPTIIGIAYDMEMYAGASDFGWDQYCLCDDCMGEFFESRGIEASAADIPTAQRKAWLEERDLWTAYQEHAHAGVERICTDIRQRVQDIAPDFSFHVLPYGDLYCNDIGSGFGTPRLPCIMMPENTYSAGYRTDVEALQMDLDRRGLPIRFALGEWVFRRTPQDWSTLSYLAATRAGGYWLYNEFPWPKVFVSSTAEERKKFKLHGTAKEWRDALTRANREIERKLADPAHEPDLPLIALHRPDYPIDFVDLLPGRASAPAEVSVRPFTEVGLYWQGRFVEVAAKRIGHQITFDLPLGYDGPYHLKTRLLRGPDRGIIQVLVDGKPVGDPIDCYYPTVAPGGDVPNAEVRLTDDVHRVAFEVVGRNPDAAGCRIGLDCMYLDYVGPFCSDWMIAGPFPNADHAAFDTVYPPEKEIRLDASYTGLEGKPVTWQRAEAGERGLLNFNDAYGGDAGKLEWAAVYALTYLHSPKERVAQVLLGSDDSCKVWLNGELVWNTGLVRRGHDADKDRFRVRLREGRNTLLVKVEQGVGGWGLRVRITDPDGSLRCSARP